MEIVSRPVSGLTREELRRRANEFRQRAETAADPGVRDTLLALAERYDELAVERD
jgi:hypothetical protein